MGNTVVCVDIDKHKIDSFQSMQNIPKKLVKILNETYFLNSLKIPSTSPEVSSLVIKSINFFFIIKIKFLLK